MQKAFFRNLIFLVTINAVIKPLWIFGIDRTVQNTVGASDYGLYFVLTNLSFLTQIILDFGINNYNNRLIAQQQSQLNTQLSNILSIKLLLAGVYLLVTITAGMFLDYSGHALCLLLLICLNQVLASLIIYVRTNISGMHHFIVDSMFSVMDKALMLIVCGALLVIPSFHSHFIIEWFVYAQLSCYLITLAAALMYVLRISGKIPVLFSFSFSKDLLRRSFPFALLIGLMMIYAKIDSVMLLHLLPADGQREAGLYASAFRLLDALNQFGYLFAVLLLPIFSRMIIRRQSIDALVRTSFTVIFIVSLTTAVGLSHYAQPVMHLLYHEDPHYSSQLLHTLIYCLIGYCTIFIFGTLLTANGNLYLLSAVSALACVINFSLNLYLIPRFKALGAAEAATITQLLIAVLNIAVAWYIFRWRVNIALLFRLGVFTLVTGLLFQLSLTLSVSWLIAAAGSAAASVLFAFAIGLINTRSIFSLLQQDATTA